MLATSGEPPGAEHVGAALERPGVQSAVDAVDAGEHVQQVLQQKLTSLTINAGVDRTAIAPTKFLGRARVAGSIDVGALEESFARPRRARLGFGLGLRL